MEVAGRARINIKRQLGQDIAFIFSIYYRYGIEVVGMK